MIIRSLDVIIQNSLETNRLTLLYWARQVGKTTLLKKIYELHKNKSIFVDCDYVDERNQLTFKNKQDVLNLIWNAEYLFIDEAQRVENIGLMLKIIHDSELPIHVLATWSSSFDLANKINEPLTWRAHDFTMFPVTLREFMHTDTRNIKQYIEHMLIYWSYPWLLPLSSHEKITYIKRLIWSYLYKDILERENIRKSEKIIQLLQLLALQIGNEVSYNELANKLHIKSETVQKYIDLLEKSFVIFKLPSFAKNLRNELGKAQKIYFFDLWVRNGLINNFNDFSLRNDLWALRENFCIISRYALNTLHHSTKMYFRRTYQQQEIDYIELKNWHLNTFEFKYSAKKLKVPKPFLDAYPESSHNLIHQWNILDFI